MLGVWFDTPTTQGGGYGPVQTVGAMVISFTGCLKANRLRRQTG